MIDNTLEGLTTLDFETKAIQGNVSVRAPEPVGLAIRWPTGQSEYLSWGHPSGNTSTYDDARRAWLHACGGPVLFHNAKFDLEVAHQHFKVPYPDEWHDSMFALFLMDPDAPNYRLKDCAERILNEPPTERDALTDWIVANVAGATKKTAPAYISKAPADLVKPYAIGDVRRTFNLFLRLWPRINARMIAAYRREQRLLPHLVEAERRGIRTDMGKLLAWEASLSPALIHCDELLRARLAAPTLNLDSNDELAAALVKEGLLRDVNDATVFQASGVPALLSVIQPFHTRADANLPPQVLVTKAKRSMARAALRQHCTDAELVAQLEYRNTMATMLRTFIEPWLDLAAPDGRLHTQWHQVRGTDKNGTRTGRIASSEPNLANIPNPVALQPPWGLPFLPSLRQALLPEEGHTWVSADYTQQELRIAAHFEDGAMMHAYNRDPHIDLHELASRLIKQHLGLDVPRKKTKTVAFASIYGAGVPQLAAQLGCSEIEAFDIREAYFKVLPGLKDLINRVRSKSRLQGFVRSLGGRDIPLEAPKTTDGRIQGFDYKQINRLVQGSAADQTKEAIACLSENGWSVSFRTQVYDEINLSVPTERVQESVDALTLAMERSMPCDVPMIVEVKTGPNHAALTPW